MKPYFDTNPLDYSSLPACEGADGAGEIFYILEERTWSGPTTVDEFIRYGAWQECAQAILTDPALLPLTRDWLTHLAAHDEIPDTISRFDIYAEIFHWGKTWETNWQEEILSPDEASYVFLERVRNIAEPLLNAGEHSKAVQKQSTKILKALEKYCKSLPEGNEAPLALVRFYLRQEEPAAFGPYFGSSYSEFLEMNPDQKKTLFAKVVESALPNPMIAEKLTGFMSHDEIRLFYAVCSELDPLVPDELRVNGRLKEDIYDPDVFPNLPQDTPYDTRQKAVEEFLGTPVLTREKIHVNRAGEEVARTTVNKYLWLGPTEVFSIDSGKPGPTTLVFSPHFHEDNPRKSFHWTKDIPLQSGRIILLPEAYRV